ncbi:MAG TPA: hypothetical protein VFU69_06540 [Ktedonobacterales bacterium]|nr:hypothetical protein [Ktedonobacterales bacterium]
MLDEGTYRVLLLVVALIHIIVLPLAIFVLGAYFTRRVTGRSKGGHAGVSLLWVAFATAIAGVPALVGGLAWNPKTAVNQITLFYLLMIVGGAIAARVPGLMSGLRLRKLPFHGIAFSLLAAVGDILGWACLDLLLLSGFAGGYVWLFILVGLPAYLGRIAAHNFNAMAQIDTRSVLASPSNTVIVPSLPATPDS